MGLPSALSFVLHLTILAFLYFGLPEFVRPLEDVKPLTVEVINASDLATAPVSTPVLPSAQAPTPPPAPTQPPPPTPPQQLAQATPPPPPPPPPTPPPPTPPPPVAPPPPAPSPVRPPAPPPPPPTPAPSPLPPPPPPKPEPPKPEPPKPEPPKPPPPKAEPPKPEPPKVEPPKPPPPKPAQQAMSFDDMMKSVQKMAPAQTPPRPAANTQTAQAQRPPGPVSPNPPSQPSAPTMGEWKPSASDEDAIRNAVAPCWSVDSGRLNSKSLKVELRIFLNPDGTVRDAQILTTGGDANMRAAAEAARRAVLNPQCNKLPLPADQLGKVPSMIFVFDPKDL